MRLAPVARSSVHRSSTLPITGRKVKPEDSGEVLEAIRNGLFAPFRVACRAALRRVIHRVGPSGGKQLIRCQTSFRDTPASPLPASSPWRGAEMRRTLAKLRSVDFYKKIPRWRLVYAAF